MAVGLDVGSKAVVGDTSGPVVKIPVRSWPDTSGLGVVAVVGTKTRDGTWVVDEVHVQRIWPICRASQRRPGLSSRSCVSVRPDSAAMLKQMSPEITV
jgi:hypothetical protein